MPMFVTTELADSSNLAFACTGLSDPVLTVMCVGKVFGDSFTVSGRGCPINTQELEASFNHRILVARNWSLFMSETTNCSACLIHGFDSFALSDGLIPTKTPRLPFVVFFSVPVPAADST